MKRLARTLVALGAIVPLGCGNTENPDAATHLSPLTVVVSTTDGALFALRVWADGSSVYSESALQREHKAGADFAFAPGPHTVEAEILASSAGQGEYTMSVKLVNLTTGASVFGTTVGPQTAAVGERLSTTFFLLPTRGSTSLGGSPGAAEQADAADEAQGGTRTAS